MVSERDVGSPFTGMIFLLRRVFPATSEARLRPFPLPDMGFAVRLPKRR